MDKDLFGNALLDYQNGKYTEDIITWTSISDKDTLPLPYLFRAHKEMPLIEQKALRLCKGKVLDVGCGAGNHSLWLQKRGFNTKAIDNSLGAITVCKQRGIANAKHLQFLDESETFDTILLLMNGTGIFETRSKLLLYLKHLKRLLLPNGQILIDSSDISYMYKDDDGGTWIDLNGRYYGELDYYLSYKGEEAASTWLYLDFETLKAACRTVGLNCKKIIEGEHYDYLAKLSHYNSTSDI